jgi:hypothetical protein
LAKDCWGQSLLDHCRSAVLYFGLRKGEGQGFDKLSPNGFVMRSRVLLIAVVLAGCAGTAPRPVAVPLVSAPIRPTGLQAVLGQPAQALIAEFGAPALDTKEAQARRLQFRSGICVLDAYLYPPDSGGEAKVTYLDTRQPDGRDIDRASCVSALRAAHGGK